MPSTPVREVVEHLEALPLDLQEHVLSMVRALDPTPQQGVAGNRLRQFAGTISRADLDAMSRVIEHGCEQVDIDEW